MKPKDYFFKTEEISTGCKNIETYFSPKKRNKSASGKTIQLYRKMQIKKFQTYL